MYSKVKRKTRSNRGSPQLLCYVCLSSDRTLSSLGKLQKVLQEITKELAIDMIPTNLLCWECIALLKKVYWFKERAKKSQILLSNLDSSELTTTKPLTNLKVVAITTTTSHKPIQEGDELLGEVEIKTETGDCITDSVNDDNSDVLDYDEIKIKTDDYHISNVVDDDNNDVFDEIDYDDDTKINKVEDIDEKNTVENVYDKDLTEIKIKDEIDHSDDPKQEDDSDYELSDHFELKLKTNNHTESSKTKKKIKTQKGRIVKKHYKLTKNNSLFHCKTEVPITLDEVMILWEKDRNSEFFKSLKKKCDICLTKVGDKVAEHKRKVHLEQVPAMDLSSEINTTINWNYCIICQDKKGGVLSKATEHGFKTFKESLSTRKMYQDTSAIELSYLFEGHITDKEVINKIKWHKICYATFTSKTNIGRKQISFQKRLTAFETPKTKYCCNICKTYMNDEETLALHTDKHCFKLQCKICGFETLLSHAMTHHLRSKHEGTFECLECGEKFENLSAFKAHFRELHKKFICDYCGTKRCRKRLLVKHIQRKHTPRQCEQCSKIYKDEYAYRTHVLLSHTVERSEATFCVTCNIQFDNIWLYKRHCSTAAVHLDEMGKRKKEKVKCPECPNIYSTKKNMKYHYRFVHLKEKRYYCTICDKRFLNSDKYSRHRRFKHENQVRNKDKLCSYCGRGFSAKKILINHIRTHTGERPYECSQCDAKFAQRTALMTHIKHIHLKVKRKTVKVMPIMTMTDLNSTYNQLFT